MHTNKYFIIIGVVLVVVLTMTSTCVVAQSERPKTQATMRSIYDSLTKAYIASLDPRVFENDDNREEILLALRTLSSNAKQLEKHDELAESLDYLQRSLARDATDAAKRFEERNYLASKYVLGNLTESCVACHSKMPNEATFDVGAAFSKDARVAQMSPRDRARLEIATRQFDKAMATYEALIAAAIMPDQLVMEGVFEEYISLCLRVEMDTKRPSKTVAAFKERHELGAPIEKRVDAWLRSLDTIDLSAAPGQELDKARAMIKTGRSMNEYPQDRNGLVQFIAASSLLHRYFETKPTDPDERAEGYYLLGVAESHASTSYWLSETEFYLTTAVDTAPASTAAHDAYTFLFDYVSNKYTGSSGVQIPLDVQDELDAVKGKLKSR